LTAFLEIFCGTLFQLNCPNAIGEVQMSDPFQITQTWNISNFLMWGTNCFTLTGDQNAVGTYGTNLFIGCPSGTVSIGNASLLGTKSFGVGSACFWSRCFGFITFSFFC
jgi:hypothetical protein